MIDKDLLAKTLELLDLAKKAHEQAVASGDDKMIALSEVVLAKAESAKNLAGVVEYFHSLKKDEDRSALSLCPGLYSKLLPGKVDLTHPDSWVGLPRATPLPEKSTYTQTVLLGGREHLVFKDDAGNTYAQALTQRGWDENIGAPYNGR